MDNPSSGNSNSNGLGKLLPKAISSKRRRNKRQQARDAEGQAANDDDEHDHSLTYQDTRESDEEEEEKSYGSYDSDRDRSLSRPGTISSHPSHTGYLTTSSPVVQATHIAESINDFDSNSSGSRSLSFPTKRSDSVDSKESSRLGRSKTGLAPPQHPNRRSPSPGGKFKGIFKSKKNSTSTERRASASVETRNPPPLRPSSSSTQSQSQHTTPPTDPEPPLVPPVIEPPAAAKVASPDRRSRAQPKLDTKIPPRTPPSSDDKSAPVIVNTPPTPVDVAYSSTQSSPERRSFWASSSPGSGANGTSAPSRAMSAHRRSQSASMSIGPSKLSNIISAPLTPTLESGEPTPNATANASSGFFSSIVSVAQNAASTFSNNISNTGIGLSGGNKSKPVTPKGPDAPAALDEPEKLDEPEVKIEPPPAAQLDDVMDQRQSALRTLGSGDLSLSQLGLAEPSSTLGSPISGRFPDMTDTRARSESAPADTGSSPVEPVHEESHSRPRSLYEPTTPTGDRTPPPPPPDFFDSKAAIQRTSSLRSAMKNPHRKRGSSVTTGGTIGAAIVAANASLAHPNSSAPKLTGFAIASKKRNREFHELFKSVPDDDYLIEDYSCALQREILAHGRLYVSEGHLCFSSNIFGWITTLVMSFDEIVSVEKRSTALVFKNGLMISTLHAKHIFASFTSRDATYDLIVNIWKLGHPTLQSTLNGVRVDTGGDKTEKVDAEEAGNEEADDGSETDDEDEDEDEEFYDEDIHDELHQNLSDANGTEAESEKPVSRKTSGVAPALTVVVGGEVTAPTGGSDDFPGPATHAPTECGDAGSHFDKIVGDDIIPAPLGKVYDLVFGQPSCTFMSQWLTGDQKCTELQMTDKKGLSLDSKVRTYSYIKPLYGSIGPKSTKCIVSEQLENLDYEKAANLIVSTQTPDVPSGNVFCVKTRYCFSWAENNSTRLQINCTIEWSGKSWLKGPIEKGATDGQVTFSKDLFTVLKAAVTTRQAQSLNALPSALKGKRKNRGARKPVQAVPGVVEVVPKRVEKKTWGLLEPIRGFLEPVLDIVQPLLTGNVMYGLLVGLLVTMWFTSGYSPKNPSSYGHDLGAYRPERLAAYEEMWRTEDGELWDWLDERVGIDQILSNRLRKQQRAVEPRTVEEKVRASQMDEREVEEAIRTTEEKLRILQGVVAKKSKRGREGAEAIPEL